jgi:signal transduction histidine kinase
VQDIGEALAEGKPVAVRLDAPESVIVHGAAGSLRRLFLNLVSNAVKFTEAGVVEIRVRGGNTEGEDPGFVEVQVRDTGSGIAPEELPRVFDRFYRADAARERSGGTGLGLAIVRMIVDQHEGEIHAVSTPGTGSIFTVRLPVARVTALVRPEPEALGRVA